ncbi:MAG: hypothetical protein LBK46_00320 [Oscillospiraceae bacterium]|jgi:hypothetical protein|nr:hypothetical protein [Oscillospiraceae bacterium]
MAYNQPNEIGSNRTVPLYHVRALEPDAAYQLADITKTRAQFGALSPRWPTRFLDFKALPTGVYRINRVNEDNEQPDTLCSKDDPLGNEIPQGFIPYQTQPREQRLSCISTIVNVDTRIQDSWSVPYDQTAEQIALAVEALKERQETQLINNPEYGLLNNLTEGMKIPTRKGAPTPDDLDDLLSMVWKEPSFFLAHPRALAAFERECTKRGVPPETAQLHGGNFLLWRGVPIVPTDKLYVDGEQRPHGSGGKTSILLVRTGEAKRGVVGLYQASVPNEQSRGLSLRFRGIDDHGVSSYLLNLYCAVAVLSDDALACLTGVDVGVYNDTRS